MRTFEASLPIGWEIPAANRAIVLDDEARFRKLGSPETGLFFMAVGRLRRRPVE